MFLLTVVLPFCIHATIATNTRLLLEERSQCTWISFSSPTDMKSRYLELNYNWNKIINFNSTILPEDGERQPADKENCHHGHQQPARPVDGGASEHS